MIKVTFEEKDNKFTLTLKGHAGQAECGQDIVCASASILAYTVAQFVIEANCQGDLKDSPILQLASGDTVISCEPTEEIIHEMRNMYRFAEIGYNLLVYNHPQYVELTPFGQSDEA